MGAIDFRHEQTVRVSAVGHQFVLLDGLRGLAAVAVVAYHFQDRADIGFAMPHAYLAVDFFFVLSGFVIAHAYQSRLQTGLRAMTFLRLRLIRLWPMLAAGTVLGAIFEFWRPVADPARHLVELAVATVLGVAAIPMLIPTPMEHTIFPINGPVWSLFYEIIASAAFLLVAKSALPRLAATGLMLGGLAGLLVWSDSYASLGALLINWPGGLPRVLFSFFAGVLLINFRSRLPATPAAVPAIALMAVLLVPGTSPEGARAIYLFAVLLVFPVVVVVGSNCTVNDRLGRLCSVAGSLSYPLYAIHYPVIRVVCFALNRSGAGLPLRLMAFVATLTGLCALSLLLFKAFDEPVRRMLARHLLPKASGVRLSSPDSGVAPGSISLKQTVLEPRT